jgi:hypothetical protein
MASLREFFVASLRYDCLLQALVSLLRSDIVDARMVVLRIVPSKVPIEIGDGLVVVQESTGILRGPFYGAEGRLDIWIVIGSSGASKQLGHAVIFTQPLDRLGFHLAAAVVDEFGPLVLRQVQDVLRYQACFQQQPRLLGRLLPTDAPLDGFARPLIQQQVSHIFTE